MAGVGGPCARMLPSFWPEDDQPIAAPLELHRTSVREEWVDYNGHLSEWAYLLVFGDNSDAFFRFIGVNDAYRAGGQSLYTAETHLRHLCEAKLGQRLTLTLQILGFDSKRLHLLHRMYRDSECAATAEQLLLHVDTRAGHVAAFSAQLAARLERIASAHAQLGVPAFVGRTIRAPDGDSKRGS
jgi:acyl-CoA thioester hydrolase